MKLHFREMGTGSPLIILHGLFGLSDNWQTLAKYLSQQYLIYLVDLRNHGRSPHSPEFTYSLMAEHIYASTIAEGIPDDSDAAPGKGTSSNN